ncbi:MAG: 4Fe-4S dicluster domain-containing protein [Planctomycetota bacterium]
MKPAEIVKAVRDAGVVGAGGAGFPTHVKLEARATWCIANGAQCEPLIRGDGYLMERRAKDVVAGLSLAMQATGATRGVIALKAKHEEALAALEKEVAGRENISIHLLKDFYPAGDEHLLVYEITGQVVPPGGIPIQVGVVVNNVETLVNIADAVRGVAAIERIVTVAGAVARPMTLAVPVGMSIASLIDIAGGATVEEFRIIEGGPMMGKLVEDVSGPVKKTTSGLIVLPTNHEQVCKRLRPLDKILLRSRTVCLNCRYCTDLCPRFLLGHPLEPHKIARVMNYTLDLLPEVVANAVLCCECGVCESYACVMGISPVRMYQEVKAKLKDLGWKSKPYEAPEPRGYRAGRFIPVSRLIARLGLTDYDLPAEWADERTEVAEVTIPLRQHLGAPAEAVVKRGDKVKRGQLIGEIPARALGARVHASIAGTVVEVGKDVRIVRN